MPFLLLQVALERQRLKQCARVKANVKCRLPEEDWQAAVLEPLIVIALSAILLFALA